MTRNILLIGVGPHAKRVYIPWILANQQRAHLAVAVEITEAASSTRNYFQSLSISPEIVFVRKPLSNQLPERLNQRLASLVKKYEIRDVIIASEPSTHLAYALWALKHDLNILMDKPITTREMASVDRKSAENILLDYLTIQSAYADARNRNSDILMSINVQRRFDPKFDMVRSLLNDVSAQTGCPVTSIQNTSADGQWRMPDEIVDIDYHGFNKGYGKASHSGYHIFDIINQFIAHGTPFHKRPDTVDIVSTSTKPSDYFAQIELSDYQHLFGKNQIKFNRSAEELIKITQDYGEIDVFTQFTFKRDSKIMCVVQSSLLHNSYSQRSWVKSREDLYKGNGRVKQESHRIQQGPLQAIEVNSYHTFEQDPSEHPYDINGSEHFDIHVFRNSKLIGGKPYQKIDARNLTPLGDREDSLSRELEGKALVMEEFFGFIEGQIQRSQLRSELPTHIESVQLMTGVYIAQITSSPHTVRLL